jgi:hypothetical protein
MNTPIGIGIVPTENATAAANTGKRIMLGQIYTEIEFPNGKVLQIRRMPMSAEILFVEYYNEMIGKVKDAKDGIFDKIKSFMTGEEANGVKFGLVEGLEMVGNLFGQLPAFQAGVIGAVMLIVKAQKGDITADEIKENLSTADCLEILSAQSEVQGLLGSFRSILAGLNPKGVV